MLTAGVMAVAAMPLSVCSVAAADSAYEVGDVDRDGIITGHDAAVVSRYLYVDPAGSVPGAVPRPQGSGSPG